MPRPSTDNRKPKSPELIAAENAGKEALRVYCRDRQGRSADIARKTRILPGTLSKMANMPDAHHINLETAVLIEVATDGVLRADVLCPSRADVLRKLLELRAGKGA